MKKYLIILTVFVLGFLLTGCEEKEDESKYKLTLYNLNEIESITIDPMSQYSNSVSVSDKSTIKIIYYLFADKKTDTESNSDTPSDVDSMYKVDFNIEKGSKTVYIYQKNGNYYLECPRYGIYESSKEDYEKLEKIVKDNTYEYNLSNFNSDDIASVRISNLSQFDDSVTIKNVKDIRILYNIFSSKNSNTASNDYNPVNHSELYHVIFSDDYGSTKEYYIYKSHERYYIEVSMYAIFDSAESEFEIVDNYFINKGKVKE